MRILHTMIRVTDLAASIEFYTKVLGMNLIRQRDNPEYKYTLAFVGYGDEEDSAVIELTYNWDTQQYDLGNGFGHLAISCNDIYQTCQDIAQHGGTISREPGPVKGGKTLIAFIKDPDGYAIELIQERT